MEDCGAFLPSHHILVLHSSLQKQVRLLSSYASQEKCMESRLPMSNYVGDNPNCNIVARAWLDLSRLHEHCLC